MTSHLPLAGYRILSAEQYGAGPYGTMFLAQLGAEVIKIEQPGSGDSARAVGPHFLRENESLFFQSFNLNKRSLTLDLNTAEGKEILHRLAAQSHAVVNNLRGDLPEKIGLTYDHLKAANPAIVCAHLSAYGRDNERTRWPGYDYLMQAEAGFMAMTGEPDALPTRFGLSIVDFMTGTMMAIGLLAALLDAGRSGQGRDVDVDLLSTAVHQTSYPAMWYLNAGDVTGRTSRSAHPSVTPSQMFRTADGWVFVMAQIPKFWTVLLDRLGLPELAEDPRFLKPADRLENRDALVAILDTVFERQPTAHWVDLLGGHMPVAPVFSLDQALDNPYLRTTGMVDTVAHPDRADMRVLANPIRIDGQRLPNRAGPLLGSDTEDVLAEAGYAAAEVAAFRAKGVI
ncbi:MULTISPECIES: CaiB/BaiF CoA transferase family protein [Sphingomonadales]|uniref:Formyl-coenzyme A transferase n=1 Tax=Edaphosphingomonas haloaromaticamans TaxID=653954 RepID=A0A1S1HEE6_9SPHN|nr:MULTISPECIES: CoA transferase [Sphingomonas]AGH47828.1 L-carnitine dehydratase/bile acid-inducible protein F [Sphingomonas sp. MM-1]MDX3882923.1 CoA transferase [Sphingomonas sp.]OHT20192.1 Formyl-coenzyme A transferase [Sphingomonas haloaromaticamans]